MFNVGTTVRAGATLPSVASVPSTASALSLNEREQSADVLLLAASFLGSSLKCSPVPSSTHPAATISPENCMACMTRFVRDVPATGPLTAKEAIACATVFELEYKMRGDPRYSSDECLAQRAQLLDSLGAKLVTSQALAQVWVAYDTGHRKVLEDSVSHAAATLFRNPQTSAAPTTVFEHILSLLHRNDELGAALRERVIPAATQAQVEAKLAKQKNPFPKLTLEFVRSMPDAGLKTDRLAQGPHYFLQQELLSNLDREATEFAHSTKCRTLEARLGEVAKLLKKGNTFDSEKITALLALREDRALLTQAFPLLRTTALNELTKFAFWPVSVSAPVRAAVLEVLHHEDIAQRTLEDRRLRGATLLFLYNNQAGDWLSSDDIKPEDGSFRQRYHTALSGLHDADARSADAVVESLRYVRSLVTLLPNVRIGLNRERYLSPDRDAHKQGHNTQSNFSSGWAPSAAAVTELLCRVKFESLRSAIGIAMPFTELIRYPTYSTGGMNATTKMDIINAVDFMRANPAQAQLVESYLKEVGLTTVICRGYGRSALVLDAGDGTVLKIRINDAQLSETLDERCLKVNPIAKHPAIAQPLETRQVGVFQIERYVGLDCRDITKEDELALIGVLKESGLILKRNCRDHQRNVVPGDITIRNIGKLLDGTPLLLDPEEIGIPEGWKLTPSALLQRWLNADGSWRQRVTL